MCYTDKNAYCIDISRSYSDFINFFINIRRRMNLREEARVREYEIIQYYQVKYRLFDNCKLIKLINYYISLHISCSDNGEW